MHLPHELNFHKSSYSATAQECVEVAEFPGGAAVRDTQNRDARALRFSVPEWRALLSAATTK